LDPNYIDAYYFRGIAYLKKSMYKEGMADLERGVAIAPASEVAPAALGPALRRSSPPDESGTMIGKTIPHYLFLD